MKQPHSPFIVLTWTLLLLEIKLEALYLNVFIKHDVVSHSINAALTLTFMND